MIQETFIREVKINYRKTREKPIRISEPQNVVDFIKGILPDNSREHCVALYLSGAQEIIYYSIVSTGTANMALLAPREIFQRAVSVGAISTLIAHNHPSGNVDPSEEDRRTTTRIKDAGDVLGIKLLDHIIVSDSDFFSFKDKGYL